MAKLKGGQITIYDGHQRLSFGDSEAELQATVTIHNSHVYRKFVIGGGLGVSQSLIDGNWTFDDLTSLVRIFIRNLQVALHESAARSLEPNIGCVDIPVEMRSATSANITIPATSDVFCVTLNGEDRADPAKVLKRIVYFHPVLITRRAEAQRRHIEVINLNRISFCGVYWKNGYHEDEVNSALAVCRLLDSSNKQSQQPTSSSVANNFEIPTTAELS